MTRWLFKEEPSHFSFDDLVRVRKTAWTGVKNALARKHLRSVKKGDRVFFYHTGNEKAIVGEMEVIRGPYADPDSNDDAAVAVDVRPVGKLPRPVTLAEIKATRALAEFALVRISRLSVMPVTSAQWSAIMRIAQEEVD